MKFRWIADVEGFDMPLLVSVAGDKYEFIYPTKNWNFKRIKGLDIKDFKLATELFFIATQGP